MTNDEFFRPKTAIFTAYCGYGLLALAVIQPIFTRDWIDAAVNIRPHIKYKVDWIVSKRMEKMGFIDTYRDINPDVLKNPGITWTPASPPIN